MQRVRTPTRCSALLRRTPWHTALVPRFVEDTKALCGSATPCTALMPVACPCINDAPRPPPVPTFPLLHMHPCSVRVQGAAQEDRVKQVGASALQLAGPCLQVYSTDPGARRGRCCWQWARRCWQWARCCVHWARCAHGLAACSARAPREAAGHGCCHVPECLCARALHFYLSYLSTGALACIYHARALSCSQPCQTHTRQLRTACTHSTIAQSVRTRRIHT